MEQQIRSMIEESIATKQNTLSLVAQIAKAADILIECLMHEGKILVCGNGGSAADAQHMAGELIGRFETERQGLPCIALTTDSSVLTAWANDYGYEGVFARQINALGRKNDVLIAISTSGQSKNILAAIEEATRKGMKVVALVGKSGGVIGTIKDVVSLVVPSERTTRIQETHLMIIHIWCSLIETSCACASN